MIAVAVGKEDAAASIRQALAMGADREIVIRTDDRLDSLLTYTALKAAIEQDGKPDIIFGGKVSIDSEGMQSYSGPPPRHRIFDFPFNFKYLAGMALISQWRIIAP